MPKIKFKMVLPSKGEEDIQPVVFKCKSCGESMRMDDIDSHAKREHNATSVMVDTTTMLTLDKDTRSYKTRSGGTEMTDTDKTVPVYIDSDDGSKIQVGWATPDNGGVRKINLLEQYNKTFIKDVKFGDVEYFASELDPNTTQADPRTFEEFDEQPFVDVSGEIVVTEEEELVVEVEETVDEEEVPEEIVVEVEETVDEEEVPEEIVVENEEAVAEDPQPSEEDEQGL